MYRHRIALAAAVIVLPFALTACSSSGSSGPAAAAGALGQKNAAPASGPASGPVAKGPAASSAFCQSLAKSSEDPAKLSSGDPSDVTPASALKDAEDALSKAPDAIKGDMQTIVNAGRAAVAKGATDTDTDDPAVDTATDHIASWATANCSFQQP